MRSRWTILEVNLHGFEFYCEFFDGSVLDTRYFWVQERVQDGDPSLKKVPTAKNCEDVGTKPVAAFSTTTTWQVCRIGVLLTMDPTLHYKMMGSVESSRRQIF